MRIGFLSFLFLLLLPTMGAEPKVVKSEDSLPSWNLNDLYKGQEDSKIGQDLGEIERETKTFLGDFQGKLTSTNLLVAIQRYEKILERLHRLMGYAYLCYATHLEDPAVLKFFQGINEKLTAISTDLVFFKLELNDMEESSLADAYKDAALKRYDTWIKHVRLFRPHLLSKEVEKYDHEKSVTGRDAWIRLHDETLARSRFALGGQSVELSKVIDEMNNGKSAEQRKEAAVSLSEGLTKQLPILMLVLNTVAKDKAIEDSWRKYPHPVAFRNLENRIDDKAVDALVATVKANYPRLSHRYYAWKAKFLKQERIEYWDRNASLSQEETRKISWEDAKEKVLKAYRDFSPQMFDAAKKFFESSWIDASPKKGKQPGAFAHPLVPSVHPYILLNYYGKIMDVTTLAHELGHGIHQVLAGSHGLLLSETPLTLAETASIFGEMLTFQALLKETKDKAEKRILLAKKIEDMLNTVIRQIAFFDFEKKIHELRKKAELTEEEIGNIWMETQAEALGPAVHLDPLVRPYWSCVSHFIHAPFYVYSYAFGCCLVNSLYALHHEGQANFHDNYLNLLKAGGSQSYEELLKPFGLDIHDSKFWQKGLDVVIHFMDELEAL